MYLFLADSGLVLKAIHLPREHGQSQEVTLEQLQVFQVQQQNAKDFYIFQPICYKPLCFVLPGIMQINEQPPFQNILKVYGKQWRKQSKTL